MLGLRGMESVIGLITIILAYFFVVTVTGVFRAWVARVMGDDTPEQMGFLNFNPLKHTDPVGFIFIILFRFGWGRYIPINPINIIGKFRGLKVLVAYLSDTFAHLIMAIVSLMILIVSFGPEVLVFSIKAMLTSTISQNNFVATYQDSSSFAISMALIISTVMYLNVLLAVLNLIISGFVFVAMILMERVSIFGKYIDIVVILVPSFLILFFIKPLLFIVALIGFTSMVIMARHPIFQKYVDILIILIPMFLIFVFINPLRFYVVYGIANIGCVLARLLGIA